MSKHKTTPRVVFLENNALDRAVLDVHIRATDFQLRYSEHGTVIKYDDAFFDRIGTDWKHNDTIILVDLGLGPDSELLMPSPAVKEKLERGEFLSFLLAFPKGESFKDFFSKLTKLDHELAGYVRRIEGLYALLRIRYLSPFMLCGIVSHFVDESIKQGLVGFVMHGTNLEENEYRGEYEEVQLILNKANLLGINERLKQAWQKWQAFTQEYYAKNIIQNCIVIDHQGTQTALTGLIKKLGERKLPQGTRPAPLIIYDTMHLQLLEGDPQATLKRVFSKLFPDISIVAQADGLDEDGCYLLIPSSDPSDTEVLLSEIRLAFNRKHPKQCICFISGDFERKPKALETLKAPFQKRLSYTIPSFSHLLEHADMNYVRAFVSSVVTSVEAYVSLEVGSQRIELAVSVDTIIESYRSSGRHTQIKTVHELWEDIKAIIESGCRTPSEIKKFLKKRTRDTKSNTTDRRLRTTI